MNDVVRQFGFLQKPDERDQLFSVAPMLMETPFITEKYWWADGWWGDQGASSMCVAYSWSHWIEDGPVVQDGLSPSRIKPLFNPAKLYEACQKRDEWPGTCVDEKTQCLTKRGWKYHNELILGEDILTFNLETQENEWSPLLAVNVYDGVEYKIWQNSNLQIAVTDNHKWVVKNRTSENNKYKLVETTSLNSSHKFPICADYSQFPKEKKYEDKFVKLVAWIAAEGAFRKNKRKQNGVYVNQKKYKEILIEILKENDINVGYYQDDLFICEFGGQKSKQLKEVMDIDKNISYDFILSLTKQQVQLFIDNLILGDGSIVNNKSSNRKQVKMFHQKVDNGNIGEIFQFCCVLLGLGISRSRKSEYFNKTKQQVEHMETWGILSSKSKDVRKLKAISQTGLVWCPTSVNKTFIAKREATVFITGNSYNGTSVRAAAKILKELGVIKEYRWANNVTEVANTLLNLGPMVVGTKWYEGMNKPNADGYILATGANQGGHAYVLNGVNTVKKVFRIKNSWGQKWGKSGHAFIKFSDFEKVLSDSSSAACIAFENKVKTIPLLENLSPPTSA